jgi:hypothetical protein
MPVTTDRLQPKLPLDRQQLSPPLPPKARKKSIEIIARMLLHALRGGAKQGPEVHHESR